MELGVEDCYIDQDFVIEIASSICLMLPDLLFNKDLTKKAMEAFALFGLPPCDSVLKDHYLAHKGKLYENTSVVVLRPINFLTHFTLHIFKGGIVDVYQSRMVFDQNDTLFKVDLFHSRKVYELISRKIQSNKPVQMNSVTS